MTVTTCVFDAYGTLFDVNAAAREAAEEPGRDAFAERWSKIATTWREKQLGYSWLRAAYGTHTDFWSVTTQALDYALELHGIADPELRDRLLQLYSELTAYAEVPEMLASLKRAGLTTAILSNGSPEMLSGAVESAGIGESLDAVLSVEQVGTFKPHRTVYELVECQFGCARRNVLFVSSNCWDACAAAGFGFVSAWVNRRGEPMDRLPWRPQHELSDLRGIPALAGAG